ncbi:unnamed protein product [Timema podura]|uniref:Uncharacterized protein n=1 Tax=Timema podura TaxID=61482 RepID=A0ABN7PLV1_TIMPD|nr:unnamed protein product [Timema podura]
MMTLLLCGKESLPKRRECKKAGNIGCVCFTQRCRRQIKNWCFGHLRTAPERLSYPQTSLKPVSP